jgi:hypothetical protein
MSTSPWYVFVICLPCYTPSIHRACDGTEEKRYNSCPLHDAPQAILDPSIGNLFANRVNSSSPSQLADQTHITPFLTEESVAALRVQNERQVLLGSAGLVILFWSADKNCAVLGPERDAEIAESKQEMLRSLHHHAGGCMHSNDPQVITCQGEPGVAKGVSPLATDLYFKRCDGRFKNLVGKELKA